MMKNYFLLFAFFTLLSFSFASDHPKLVIELFRHGARGPLYHKNDSYWRGKEGQLTDIGKAQHLVLGASLMERYPHLKESLKDPSKLYLQSTQYKRTLQSLKFHLWGMYNGGNITFSDLNIYDPSFYSKYQNHSAFKKFNPFNLTEIMNFTPAPIKINPIAQDYELLTLELPFCKNTDSLLGVEHADNFDFFMDMVSHHVKYYLDKSLNGQQIYDVYDLVYANLFEGKDLIHNITTDSKAWKHIKHGAEYFVTYMRYGSELKRTLYGMPLFKKILGLLEKSFEGVLPYDLVLLSAHDITVFNLLTALNVIHPQCFIDKMKGDTGNQHCHFPNYASQILVELWERDGVPKIKILYEKEVINLCKTEDGECTFRQLQDLFEKDFANIRVEDIFGHCGVEQSCKLDDEDAEVDDMLPLCEFNENHW